MKTFFKIPLLLLFLSAGVARAQYYIGDDGKIRLDLGFDDNKYLKELIKKNSVESLDLRYTKVKKDKVKSTTKSRYYFNQQGVPVRIVTYNAKNKIKKDDHFVYDDQLKVVQRYQINSKGDTLLFYSAKYDEAGHRIQYSNRIKNRTYSSVSEFNDSAIIKYSTYINGKFKSYYVYEYYPNGDRKTTRYFNRKGKEKYVWSYACSEEGKEIARHKDTSTVCLKKTENPDGTTTSVWQSTDEKGKITKSIYVYNKVDKIISFKYFKGVEEQLVVEWTKIFVSDTILISSSSTNYSDGKKNRQNHEEFNEAGQILSRKYSWYNGSGKLKSNWIIDYVYGDNGLLIKMKSSDGKEKVQYLSEASYVTAKH
ncbi:MAG: hypothetical protein GC181_07190 [Bacteroidetes bacterium]|nr:hypothetical protein [Bacteroidota bacterium]